MNYQGNEDYITSSFTVCPYLLVLFITSYVCCFNATWISVYNWNPRHQGHAITDRSTGDDRDVEILSYKVYFKASFIQLIQNEAEVP